MLSFTFGGKDSYMDFGILISKRPVIPSPKRRVRYIDIPGRHSRLRYDEATYEDITIAVECVVKDRENLAIKQDEIKAWLFNAGESDLIFSFQPDRKYIAQMVNAIDFTQIFKYTAKFSVLFNCRPFKYAVENNIITVTENGTYINNPGTVESEPILTVYGMGDITFTVNEQTIELTDVPSKMVLNTALKDAYDENGNSLNSKMTGQFPILNPGQNLIEWTGNVEKTEILPNWRWL